MDTIDKRLADILCGYAAICNLPDYHDRSLEVAIQQIKSLFDYKETKSLEERREDFYNECKTLVKEDRSNVQQLTDFYNYWSACKSKGSKMAFEKEKSWNLKARYSTWERNSKKFSIAQMLRK